MQDNLHFIMNTDYSGGIGGLVDIIGGVGILAILFACLVIPALIFMYFLPSYLSRRKNDNFWFVFILNILTGRTIVGWAGCIILALCDKDDE